MSALQLICNHPGCGAKCNLMASTRLPDGRKRRRFWCESPAQHRFTVDEEQASPLRGKRKVKPPATWAGEILTEWRAYPFNVST